MAKNMPKKMHWLTWMGMIPNSEVKAIREKIIADCKCSLATFYNWRGRYNDVPPLAQEKIQAIAGDLIRLDFTFTPREKSPMIESES